MKLLTYEISDRSLALTTLNKVNGYWNCTLVLSREASDKHSQIAFTKRQFFTRDDGGDALIGLTLDDTSAYIEAFFPELVGDDQ